VVRFLSPDWFAVLDRAAKAVPPFASVDGAPLVIEQVAEGEDGSRVVWHLTLDAHGASVAVGPAEQPTVRFTTSIEVAEAIVRGTDDPRRAFLRGDLRIGGDTERLVAHAAALTDLDDVFATARRELDD